jgi:hypothetical protein
LEVVKDLGRRDALVREQLVLARRLVAAPFEFDVADRAVPSLARSGVADPSFREDRMLDSMVVQIEGEALRWARVAAGYTGESVVAYVQRVLVERGRADAVHMHGLLLNGDDSREAAPAPPEHASSAVSELDRRAFDRTLKSIYAGEAGKLGDEAAIIQRVLAGLDLALSHPQLGSDSTAAMTGTLSADVCPGEPDRSPESAAEVRRPDTHSQRRHGLRPVALIAAEYLREYGLTSVSTKDTAVLLAIAACAGIAGEAQSSDKLTMMAIDRSNRGYLVKGYIRKGRRIRCFWLPEAAPPHEPIV